MSAITPKIASFVGANADAVAKESMRSWGISLEKMAVIHYLTIAELRADTTGDARACFVANARYLYDSADTLTADDGAATLVSADGKRWKRQATGSGDMLAANNLSDVASRVAAYNNLRTRGVDIASAPTLDLDAATGDLIDVTGTTAITAVTLADGDERTLRFTGILTFTHGANLVLPGAANITTAAGDFAKVRGYASGLVRCTDYTRANGTALVTSGGSGGGGGAPTAPQGRICLATGAPVPVASVAATNTVRYAPYLGQYFPLWDGTAFVNTDFGGELSQLTTDTTKSPAACAANSNYDIFGWLDGSTKRATRGPAWSNSGAGTSARGTGAGTTELELLNGFLVNKIAITNGPAARAGIYLGTIRTNGSSLVEWTVNTSGAGGAESRLHVWNMYNRVDVATTVNDTADSWTSTANAYEALNVGVGSGAGNRVSFIRGLDEDAMLADLRMPASHNAGSNGGVGIGLNSSSANAAHALCSVTLSSAFIIPPSATYNGAPGLGHGYFQALQRPAASGTTTFYGDVGLTFFKSGMQVSARM
jgi:hypothetical protein